MFQHKTVCFFHVQVFLLVAVHAFARPHELPGLEVLSRKGDPVSIQSNYTSIALFDAATLAALPEISDVGTVLLYVPNAGLEGRQGFSLRGIHTAEADSFFGMYDSGQVVGFFVDGAPVQNRQLNNSVFDLWDVSAVEVVRGPSSTIQGGDSLAGSVFVRTRDPSFVHEGRARAGYADYKSWQAAAAQGGPLSGNLAYRVALDYQASDGYSKTPAGHKDVAARDSATGRLKLLYAPRENEALTVRGHVQVNRQHVNPQSDLILLEEAGRRVTPEYVARDDSRADAASGGVQVELAAAGGWTLVWDAFASGYRFDGINQWYHNKGDADLAEKAFSTELRARRKGERHEALLGFFLSRKEHDSTYDFRGLTDPVSRITLDMNYDARYERDSLALYGQFDYDLLPRLTLRGGLRADYEVVDQRAAQTYDSRMVPSIRYLSGRGDFDDDFFALLPSASLVFRFDDRRSLSLGVQRAFRSGGLSIPIGHVQARPEAFDPEYSWNYELAFRSTWLDRQATLNLNVFRTDWRDRQMRVPTGYHDLRNIPVYSTRNFSGATLTGGEIEFAFAPRLVEGLTFFGGVGYTDAAAQDGDGQVWTSGNFHEGHQYNVVGGVDYLMLAGVRFGVNATHHNRSRDPQLDDYTLLNASMAYSRSNWTLSLFARNLADEEWLQFRENQWAAMGPPRSFGAQLDYVW